MAPGRLACTTALAALALAACGSGTRSLDATPPTTTAASRGPIVAAPDAAAAAAVPVSGASKTQEAAIRETLTALGGPSPVARVEVVDGRLRLAMAPAEALGAPAMRSPDLVLGLGQAAGTDMLARLRAAGEPLARLGVVAGDARQGGQRFGSGHGAPDGFAASAQAAVEQAAAHGVEAAWARAVPVAGGVLAVVVTPDERELLTGAADQATAFGDLRHVVTVVARDGTVVAGAGAGARYSADGATLPAGGPVGLAGPTRLTVELLRRRGTSAVPGCSLVVAGPRDERAGFACTRGATPLAGSAGEIPGATSGRPEPRWLPAGVASQRALSGERLERTFLLDCDGGASAGVADPSAACAALVGQRYLLLVRPPTGSVCAGGLGTGPQATVAGTFRGVAIERSYGECTRPAAQGWFDLLGVAALPG